MKLKTKFLCLIAVLLAVSLGANLVWTSANKHSQMENELREQARALAQQMDAVWEFMVANQDRLSHYRSVFHDAFRLHDAVREFQPTQ